MTAHLIRGDARRLPLATGSVQAIVTSPPYFNLRSYGQQLSTWGGREDCDHQWSERSSALAFGAVNANGKSTLTGGRDKYATASHDTSTATCSLCQCWRGELGSEPTPAAFVAHLVEVMRECWRVLRDDGCLFLNMGDSYSGGGGFDPNAPSNRNGSKQSTHPGTTPYKGRQPAPGTRPKSLLLVPERLAIALSDDGWIVRQVLIWAKNNPMPESVRDRWTTAHEYVLMLVKQPRYFFDQAGIAEPLQESSLERGYSYVGRDETSPKTLAAGDDVRAKANWRANSYVPATRNGRSVWNISTAPYPGAHYAVFSPEIPRRCILAATSEYGACAACGAPWRRVVERDDSGPPTGYAARIAAGVVRHHENGAAIGNTSDPQRPPHGAGSVVTRTAGWAASCKCGPAAGVRPCVVLDPFSGSGTVAYQAARMGRVGIGVELSEEYLRQTQAGRLAQGFLPLAAPPLEAPRLPLDTKESA